MEQLDSGCSVSGILEVMPDGFGFIRSDNYLPGENDVYVSPAQIRRFGLKTGDILSGNTRIKTQSEKFSALLYVTTVNGYHPAEAAKRPNFEELTPIFPKDRIRLEQPGSLSLIHISHLTLRSIFPNRKKIRKRLPLQEKRNPLPIQNVSSAWKTKAMPDVPTILQERTTASSRSRSRDAAGDSSILLTFITTNTASYLTANMFR